MPTVEPANPLRSGADAGQPDPRPATIHERRVVWQTPVLGALAVYLGVIWFVQRSVFQTAMYPYGDEAANTLSVIRAEHFAQLEGNYSRTGFHHPGPALFYLLAAGEELFHRVLSIVPAPFNGQTLVSSILTVTLVALSAGAIGRMCGSRWAGLVAFVAAMAILTQLGFVGVLWFPFLYLPPFLALGVGAARFAAGATRTLPLLVFSGGVLVHGHVSFFMFVGVTSVVALVGWLLTHRKGWRAELGRHRASVLVSAGLAALFLLPMLILTVTQFPEPWRSYVRFSLGAERDERTIADSVSFVLDYVHTMPGGARFYVVTAVVGIGLLLLDRRRARRRALVWSYAVQGLLTMLTLFYVHRGVDHLQPHEIFGYVALFFRMVPVALVMTVVAHAVTLAGEATQARASRRRVLWILDAGLVVGLTWVALSTPSLTVVSPPRAEYHEVATVLRDAPGRHGRMVALDQDEPDGWPDTVGVGAELQRLGVAWCARSVSPAVDTIYSRAFLCTDGTDHFEVGTTTGVGPSGAEVLWSGAMTIEHMVFYLRT